MKIKIKAKDYQLKKANDIHDDFFKEKAYHVTVDMTDKFYKDHEDQDLESFELMDKVEEKLKEIADDLGMTHIDFDYYGGEYDFISDVCSLENTRDMKHAIQNYYGEWANVKVIRET